MYTIQFTLNNATMVREYQDVKRAFDSLYEMVRDGVKNAVLTKGHNILVEVCDGEVVL